MPPKRQCVRNKFSFVEHLTEAFSTSCASVCTQENIDPSVRAACDVGSQEYCTTDNISSSDCLSYASRLVRTLATERTNEVYANPVIIPKTSKQTIASYYSALGGATRAYVLKNIDNLSSDNVTNLMRIFLAEDPSKEVYTTVSDAAITELSKDARPTNFGLGITWLNDRAEQLIDQRVSSHSNRSTSEVIKQINDDSRFMNMFMHKYERVFDVVISKLTIEDITIPLLYEIDYLRVRTHAFIVKYITGADRGIGNYEVDLSKSERLYNRHVLEAHKWLTINSPSDPLIKLINDARVENLKYYISVNDPMSDSLCIAMVLAGEQVPYAARCAEMSNIVKADCVAFIDKKLQEPGALKDDIYMAILKTATDKDGNINKLVLDTYPGMKPWLQTIASDQLTIIDGVRTVTPVCGTVGNLTIAQCNQLCKLYPDICAFDKEQKCRLPQYRFNQESFCIDPVDESHVHWWWIGFIVFVIFIALFICKRRTKSLLVKPRVVRHLHKK